MISKVELGSVNNKKAPLQNTSRHSVDQTSFNGLGTVARKLIQTCEEKPMVNVAVLDFTTAILPRSVAETVIGSKQKDEEGNVTHRRFNFLAGFEAFRREGSGLLINCIIPSFIVIGAAKLLNRPIMQGFKTSNLTKSWANDDTINVLDNYYKKAQSLTKEDRIVETLKKIFNDIEGVDGDINKGGLKKFADIFAQDPEFDKLLRKTSQEILSDNPKKHYADELYKYLIKKSGISENLRFTGKEGFFASNLKHLCESVCDILHGASKEGILKDYDKFITAQDAKRMMTEEFGDFSKYVHKAKKLVNAKSLAGLGIIIPLAIAAQPINRWITHKMAGKKGAPIYNDDEERILTHDEKKKLNAEKILAVPAMLGVAALSMIMDRPSLKMFQFKGIFPTMDQARLISAATFSSRIAASEDSNELKENTIRDIATFSSFYFLGDYAAKGLATYLENHNKDGIKLTNKLKAPKENASKLSKFWNWAKDTKMKSTDELSAIANKTLREKAVNMRAFCQLGNLAFSLLALGVFIPLYTRTQTNKKKHAELGKIAQTQASSTSFTSNNIPTFKSFFG